MTVALFVIIMSCLYPREIWDKFPLYLATIAILVVLLAAIFFVLRQGENSNAKKRF